MPEADHEAFPVGSRLGVASVPSIRKPAAEQIATQGENASSGKALGRRSGDASTTRCANGQRSRGSRARYHDQGCGIFRAFFAVQPCATKRQSRCGA